MKRLWEGGDSRLCKGKQATTDLLIKKPDKGTLLPWSATDLTVPGPTRPVTAPIPTPLWLQASRVPHDYHLTKLRNVFLSHPIIAA